MGIKQKMTFTKEKIGTIETIETQGEKVCKVKDILDWITSMEIGGMMQHAKTDELKTLKRGELLMLKKIRFAISGKQ